MYSEDSLGELQLHANSTCRYQMTGHHQLQVLQVGGSGTPLLVFKLKMYTYLFINFEVVHVHNGIT